ncbi:MAG: sensor histidine kinase [Ruthenibacterium lactatiformans]
MYNTLDSIRWKAERAGAQDISRMTTALATLFRIGLSRGRDHFRGAGSAACGQLSADSEAALRRKAELYGGAFAGYPTTLYR